MVSARYRFESFKEMLQFALEHKGKVCLARYSEEGTLCMYVTECGDGSFSFRMGSSGTCGVIDILLARDILPDMSNVDEAELARRFELGDFFGEVRTME